MTDHESLKWLLTQKELDRQQAKWVHVLSQFDVDIVYPPGRINPADALSRHPMHRLAAVSLVQTSLELLERFAAAYEADPLYHAVDPPSQGDASQAMADASRGQNFQTRSPNRIGSLTDPRLDHLAAENRGPCGTKKPMACTRSVCLQNPTSGSW